jgi:hypothetical protein
MRPVPGAFAKEVPPLVPFSKAAFADREAEQDGDTTIHRTARPIQFANTTLSVINITYVPSVYKL